MSKIVHGDYKKFTIAEDNFSNCKVNSNLNNQLNNNARSSSFRKKMNGAMSLSVAATLFLSGCISTSPDSSGRYANPIGGSAVISNDTPYSDALYCLGARAVTEGFLVPKIAVGSIPDYTNKLDADGGDRVTQGATLMAISALSKAGVRLVERYSLDVANAELNYTNNKLLAGDGKNVFRPLLAGSIAGSDYFLVGGITELNYDIRSGGLEGIYDDTAAFAPKGTASDKAYVMNVAIDLRMVDSRSLEIVDVVSYQKQIVGWEYSAGIFSFLNKLHLFDIGVGEKALEPIQLAVRASIERATLEMIARLYDVNPRGCDATFGTDEDPLGPIPERQGAALKNIRSSSHEDRVASYIEKENTLVIAQAKLSPVSQSNLTNHHIAENSSELSDDTILKNDAAQALKLIARLSDATDFGTVDSEFSEDNAFNTITIAATFSQGEQFENKQYGYESIVEGREVKLGLPIYANLQAESLSYLRIPSPRQLLNFSWDNTAPNSGLISSIG